MPSKISYTTLYYGRHTISAQYVQDSILPRIAKHSRAAPSGCVEWIGSNVNGYAELNCKTDEGLYIGVAIHRMVAILKYGHAKSIGMDTDHTCRNTICINGDHLEFVTHLVNVRRGALAAVNSALRTGLPSVMLGKRHSEETKAKMRAAQQARRAAERT